LSRCNPFEALESSFLIYFIVTINEALELMVLAKGQIFQFGTLTSNAILVEKG